MLMYSIPMYSIYVQDYNELHESIYDNALDDSHCDDVNDDPIMSQIQDKDLNSKSNDSCMPDEVNKVIIKI